jgi:hypothetical protein
VTILQIDFNKIESMTIPGMNDGCFLYYPMICMVARRFSSSSWM